MEAKRWIVLAQIYAESQAGKDSVYKVFQSYFIHRECESSSSSTNADFRSHYKPLRINSEKMPISFHMSIWLSLSHWKVFLKFDVWDKLQILLK
jgi:hypothetical protein